MHFQATLCADQTLPAGVESVASDTETVVRLCVSRLNGAANNRHEHFRVPVGTENSVRSKNTGVPIIREIMVAYRGVFT